MASGDCVISFSQDTMENVTLSEVIPELVGVGASAYNHRSLSVSSVFVAKDGDIAFVSSDYSGERELFCDMVAIELRKLGFDWSLPQDYVNLGSFKAEVVDVPMYVMTPTLKPILYDRAARALRSNLVAWAHHRCRFVLAIFHMGEWANEYDPENPDDDEMKLPHAHIFYQRMLDDDLHIMSAEIMDIMEHKVTWDSIDLVLGFIPAPVYDDEEAYDTEGWFDEPPDVQETDYEIEEDMSDVPFMNEE